MTARTSLPRGLVTMNRVVKAMLRLGLKMGPVSVLTVPGRRSGKPRSTPVSPYVVDGRTYVLSGIPGSDWERNILAAGGGTLSRGRRKTEVRLTAVPAEESGPLLREFAVRLPQGVDMMVKAGTVEHGTPDEFEAAAGRMIVFRVDGL